MIILQVLCWTLATVWMALGKFLAFFMVPIGIWTNWKYTWITWPWDASHNSGTGSYYDGWYNNPENSRFNWFSRWAHDKPFWREYYWKTRNGFSNGMRYAIPHTPREDVIREKLKHGFREYDVRRPWLMRIKLDFHPLWADSRGKYIQVYVGFKVDREDGSGFTNRLPFRIRSKKG